jgi:hypothetical protein
MLVHTARVRAAALVLIAALLAASPGTGTALAAEPAAGRAATDDEAPRDPEPAPGLRLDDRRAASTAAATEAEPRPFWKSWIFWTVAGALVAGGVALAVYSASGSTSDVEPCPGEIGASLGCYGAGSGR